MRVQEQVLSPRVQNAEKTNLRAEMLGMACNLAECFRHGAKQEVVEFRLILQDERVEFMRQREDHVEVSGKCCRQHLCLYVLFPDMWSSPLSLATVAPAVRGNTT